MKKIVFFSACLLPAIGFLTACQSFFGPSFSFQTSPDSPLQAGRAAFGSALEDKTYKKKTFSTYKQGEKIIFTLFDVGPFVKGQDGKHWINLDMEIRDSNGDVSYFNKNLLGSTGGHLELPNNHAKSPTGVFGSTATLEPGDYTFTLTVHDKVKNTWIAGSGPFTIVKKESETENGAKGSTDSTIFEATSPAAPGKDSAQSDAQTLNPGEIQPLAPDSPDEKTQNSDRG